MEEDKDAFFVVRKGDVVGLYKSLMDCQNQAGSSVCHPSLSVYRGHSLSKEAEKHLVSHGLKNALYTINAKYLQDDIFGKLVPCPIQEPYSISGKSVTLDLSEEGMTYTYEYGGTGQPVANSLDPESCVLAFDGSSDEVPGRCGAGAVLRAEDGTAIIELREGLGRVRRTNAAYRALILGLKYALKKGYKKIRVQGDSKVVCYQAQGFWHPNIYHVDFYEVVSELKAKFASFEIKHVYKECNSKANVQANRAINLRDGQVEVHTTIFDRVRGIIN